MSIEKGQLLDDTKVSIEGDHSSKVPPRASYSENVSRALFFTLLVGSSVLAIQNFQLRGQLEGQLRQLTNAMQSLQDEQYTYTFLQQDIVRVRDFHWALLRNVETMQGQVRDVVSEVEELKRLHVNYASTTEGPVYVEPRPISEDLRPIVEEPRPFSEQSLPTEAVDDDENQVDPFDSENDSSGDFYLKDTDVLDGYDDGLIDDSDSPLDIMDSFPDPFSVFSQAERVARVKRDLDGGSQATGRKSPKRGSTLTNKSDRSDVYSRNSNQAGDADRKSQGKSQIKKDSKKRHQVQGKGAAHFEAFRDPAKYHISSHVAPVILPIWRDSNISTSSSLSGIQLNPSTGIVRVGQEGLYWTYSQIVYHDLTTRWAFGIFVNDTVRIKCINTEQHIGRTAARNSPPSLDDVSAKTSHSHAVYQHCYTASVLALRPNDEISIRCLYGGKTIVMQPELTFWGLVKFS